MIRTQAKLEFGKKGNLYVISGAYQIVFSIFTDSKLVSQSVSDLSLQML